VNKPSYFSLPSTPCLCQQPHENINRSTHHLQHTQISSNFSTITADNSTGMYTIHYSIELIAFSAEYTLFNNCNFNLIYRYSLSKFNSFYYSVMFTRRCRSSCFVLLRMGADNTRNMKSNYHIK
jgi:hypothetical protein